MLDLLPSSFTALIAFGGLLLLTVIISFLFRVVVPTNAVHIVQSSSKTISYGKGKGSNTYYKWPSWIPRFGVQVIELPVSVFDQTLNAYAAYDKGRLPFVIDIIAFFRITDSNVAAERIKSFDELLEQLKSILQGAVRTILASSEIEEILEGRSKFGEMFTKEVDHQLVEWGVQNVKCIELMDIRDADGSHVISNIMAKKKSLIEMQSRVEVASNIKSAEMAEIEAKQAVQIRGQEAEQAVGIRTAEKDQKVGISREQAQQEIKSQAAITASKTMDVLRVEQVQQAEINKAVQVVEAEQEKATAVLVAEGSLASTKLLSEGIQIEGTAKAEAAKAMQLAPVQAQITLAKEIGNNPGYQTYLVNLKGIEAAQVVGVEQAKALEKADLKVIANAGTAIEGVKSVSELFSSKGGTNFGAMLEAFAQTPMGKALLDKIAVAETTAPKTTTYSAEEAPLAG